MDASRVGVPCTAMPRVLIALLAMVVVACSSSSSGGAEGWAGTWSCTLTLEAGGQSAQATTVLSITQGSGGQITITPVSDGGGGCNYTVATTNGTSGTFDASQPCGQSTVTEGGDLQLSGSTLTYTLTAMAGGQTEHGEGHLYPAVRAGRPGPISHHQGATSHAIQPSRQDRPLRLGALPRRDDLRRQGLLAGHRHSSAPRRSRRSSAPRSTPASTSSTRPTSTPTARASGSSAPR